MHDPFATERNGHKLVDMYDPKTNTLDIISKGLYPSNVLSNLYNNAFRFDGIYCGSMEGLLQSLKYAEGNTQRKICALSGGEAKNMSIEAWQISQTLWWKGKPLKRDSYDFIKLVSTAYVTLGHQNRTFRRALLATKGITLTHSIGLDDKSKTILTASEFCSILTLLREQLLKQQKINTIKLCLCGCLFLFIAFFCLHLAIESEPQVFTGKLVSSLMFFVFGAVAFALPIHENLTIKRLRKIVLGERMPQ